MSFHLAKLLVYHPYFILLQTTETRLISELIFFGGGGWGLFQKSTHKRVKKKKHVFINILYYVGEKPTHFFELLHEIL